jgi:hypothetical protein
MSVNKYVWNENIDEQQFFLKHNDIGIMEFAPIYGRYKGLYCCACERLASCCDCVFVCGLSRPTGQRDRKTGQYCQFKKCKWYTNNLENVVHDCEGVIETHDVFKFKTIDSRSCVKLCDDFSEFDEYLKYFNK